jgi:hypothetical protein
MPFVLSSFVELTQRALDALLVPVAFAGNLSHRCERAISNVAQRNPLGRLFQLFDPTSIPYRFDNSSRYLSESLAARSAV